MGLGSEGKKRKVEREFTKPERINILKTRKVLSGRVFDIEIQSKSGMRDLADV